jgi:ATP-dependent Clp protease adaptor protein ClpS
MTAERPSRCRIVYVIIGTVDGPQTRKVRVDAIAGEEEAMGRREFEEADRDVVTESEKKLKPPAMYKVLLHNDDYTTMEFVVQILQSVFQRSHAEATAIMLHVHRNGIGVAGVYTYEVAETKVAIVDAMARQHEFPLKCTLEPT